jgi:hypothetical protein
MSIVCWWCGLTWEGEVDADVDGCGLREWYRLYSCVWWFHGQACDSNELAQFWWWLYKEKTSTPYFTSSASQGSSWTSSKIHWPCDKCLVVFVRLWVGTEKFGSSCDLCNLTERATINSKASCCMWNSLQYTWCWHSCSWSRTGTRKVLFHLISK